MSVFTPAEIDYLNGQLLGRLATAGADGKPHVVPVSFSYNAELETIDIGGHNFGERKKWNPPRSAAWRARCDLVVGVARYGRRQVSTCGRPV